MMEIAEPEQNKEKIIKINEDSIRDQRKERKLVPAASGAGTLTITTLES